MARRSAPRRTRPDPPTDPDAYDPAPAAGATWDGVAAGEATPVDSHVADWTIRESLLTGVDLTGRRLETLRCRDTRFVRCDLSGAVLQDAQLDRVVFDGCRLTGAVLTGARLGDVVLHDCSAELLDLGRIRAHRLLLDGTRARSVDLTGAEIVDSGLLRSDLSGAVLYEARLSGVRLHGSEVTGVRNALALRGVTIGSEQRDAVAALLLDALDVTVDDDV